MKIILIGANGTIGELVQKALAGAGHEIVKVGRKSGDFQVEIENRESVRKLYQAVGSFDAVAIAAGEVAFAPLSELTAEKWQFSLGSKLMGQISLVQEAIPFINEKGSFTLVSGVLNDEPIFAGVAASTVSGALEGFVRAAAIELPKGLRINVVSPTILEESEAQFGFVLSRRDSGRRMESWHKPTNALSWGRKPAAFTKLIELTQRLFEDRPATSQESGLTKESTCCN